MSRAENDGGLVLAASPMAKIKLGISNVTRKNEIPSHPDLKIVSPRMNLYIQENIRINAIYQRFVAEEDLHIYSIDESFLDVTDSLAYWRMNTSELAAYIQKTVYQETGLYVTIGIGDNPLLAKLALDIEAKKQVPFRAEWRYKDVFSKVWRISPIDGMWGIGKRTARRLKQLGIDSIEQLAQTNCTVLKQQLGVIGEQLYAHAWGIDRSRLAQKYQSIEKSYENSQILPRDYNRQKDIEIVICEMADQVAARLRRHHCQTGCVRLRIGFSACYCQKSTGFARQMAVPLTNQSKRLTQYCLSLFRKHWKGQEVRQIGIAYSQLVYHTNIQLDLFQDPEEQMVETKLEQVIDTIRKRYGYTALIHAHSLSQGGTAVQRSNLVGGHAGGMEGLQ